MPTQMLMPALVVNLTQSLTPLTGCVIQLLVFTFILLFSCDCFFFCQLLVIKVILVFSVFAVCFLLCLIFAVTYQ